MKAWMLVLLLVSGAAVARGVEKVEDFELTDQDARLRRYRFPKEKVTLMTVADYKGSAQIEPWIQAVFARYGTTIDIDGVADVSIIARPFHGLFRRAFKQRLAYSVMLDWDGTVVRQFQPRKGVANLYVIDREGRIVKELSGPVNPAAFRALTEAIDRACKVAPGVGKTAQ